MNATLLRSIVVRGFVVCATPLLCLGAQAGVQRPMHTVMVTPLLHSGVLSDSLALLVRQELALQPGIALLSGNVSSLQQRPDSVGKPWTIESLRDFAVMRKAEALVDVSAMRVGDSVQVSVVKGRLPYQIIDSYRRSTRDPLTVIAQSVAQQVTRNGWPANEH